MAKPKRGGGSGPHKNHGPKRHLFKEFKPMVHVFAKAGLLTKFNNEESWMIAMAARGQKGANHEEWLRFSKLSLEEQKNYFNNLKK